MKFTRLFIWTLISLFGLITTQCISDDISTSSSDLLTFSRDTVSFDTIFTEVGTPTARLIVRNPNSNGVKISHIAFRNPSTRFRLNVDGFSGDSFSDIEIRAKDSIYVFIECYPEEAPSSEPALIEDKLDFVTNGVTQSVQVEAWGQNVTRLSSVTISENTVFTAEQPYVVFDSLIVAPGVKLEIRPGSRILFHDKARMVVRGQLEAIGTPDSVIDMRGDRLDNVLPNVSYDIMAGQWSGLRFAPESYENRMEYVNFRSSSEGLSIDSCGNVQQQKLLLLNSWIHNSQATAFKSSHAWVDAYGTVFSEAANAVVSLTGGKHTFTQCTLSNNYLFAAITQPLLCLSYLFDVDAPDADINPLMQASFNNCIIYGLADDINCPSLAGSNVFLRTCMLKSKGSNDDNFIDCIWDADPLFRTIRQDYYFNYRLQAESPAIGAANPMYITDICIIDPDGLNRLSGGRPDLGAYVYVPIPSK